MIKLKNLLNENDANVRYELKKYLGDQGYMKNFKLWRSLIFNEDESPYIMISSNHTYWGSIITWQTVQPLQKKIDKLKIISPTAPIETGTATDYEIYNGGLYFLYDWLYFEYNAKKIRKTFGEIPYDFQPPAQPFWDWLSAMHDIDVIDKVENNYRNDVTFQKEALDLFAKYYNEYITWYKKNKPGKPIPKHPYSFTATQLQAAKNNGWGDDVRGFASSGLLPKTFQRPPEIQYPINIPTDLGLILLR